MQSMMHVSHSRTAFHLDRAFPKASILDVLTKEKLRFWIRKMVVQSQCFRGIESTENDDELPYKFFGRAHKGNVQAHVEYRLMECIAEITL